MKEKYNEVKYYYSCYKVQRYLEHTINSILYQNYDDYEIILVDDASPDNCGEFVTTLQKTMKG